jgi:DNA-binding transcriptional LysR family regulator
VAQAVADNRADIGILADSADLTGLETFAFVVDRLVLVMPRGHRFARRRQIALREADGHDFVGLAADSPLQEYVARHAARSGARTRQRINLPGFDAICRMAARGVGLGVVPEAAARRCRRSMAIAAVRLTDSWAPRHLTICVRRLDALPAYTQALVRHLRASGGAGPKPDTTDE